MSNHASVVETVLPQVETGATSASAKCSRATRAYSELAARLFAGPAPLSLVAFVSINSGEGVTRTLRYTAVESQRQGKNVVVMDGAQYLLEELETLHARDRGIGPARLLPYGSEADRKGATHELMAVRERQDATLLDCGSLEASAQILRLAPVVDGIVLVIEAGRTRKSQIERATRLIRESRGRLVGIVLNKRRYAIPGWLFRLL